MKQIYYIYNVGDGMEYTPFRHSSVPVYIYSIHCSVYIHACVYTLYGVYAIVDDNLHASEYF